MPKHDILTLAVQLLVWARLGKKEWVTHSVPSLAQAIEQGGTLLQAGLFQLENSSGTLHEAFAGVRRRAELAGPALHPTAAACHRVERDGLLDGIQIYELFSSLGPEFGPELTLYHSSLTELMVRLAGPTAGTTTYCPWDQVAQVSSGVLRVGGEPAVENPLITPFPALAAVASGNSCRTAYSDPIRSPSFIEGGKLESFDQAVALPPLGVKVDRELADRDLFGRFNISNATWTVLCIQHLMACSRRRVVVVVPYSLLFGMGADRKLREQLVRAGQVRTVISLFPGLASGTAIQLALLVLDPRGGMKQVRFVNAGGEQFKAQFGRAKVALDKLDDLVREIGSGGASEIGRSVDPAEIQKNDFSLQVERYVVHQDRLALQQRLAHLKTACLGDLVSTVRSPSVSKSDSDSIPALEVGASDIPRTGFTRPSREVMVTEATGQGADHFLREGDIVVTIRGSVGKVGIIPGDVAKAGPGGWTAGSSLAVLRTRSDALVHPAVLMLLLRSPMGQELLSGISSGVAIPMITLRDLLRLEIPVPLPKAFKKAEEILDQEEGLRKQIAEIIERQDNVAGSDSAYGLLGESEEDETS
ncbi:N-6 DNA methylase [Luteimonas sp. MC1825]|uniref:N-6 DNA methylase n=1 Tax=Luteimonas sp. MC1825 TaxID=2761107 RepID=UPI0016102018|nr:N-6 DNA methylase [Luteimonas sp. MC1825]MBB6600302.1 N-6 DNA methylase [Luteimonas sp. MC1825]QOC87982.1 N-6 DNA methylase [Luteimonas sp. MC1825]